MPEVTICPPATFTAVPFDKFLFDGGAHQSRAVAAHYVGARNGENGWESTGLSFDNYASMTTQIKNQSGQRRIKTPAWAMSNRSLQMVITEYLLQRALGSRKQRADAFRTTTATMTPLEKLRFAEETLRAKIPAMEVTIHHLIEEYVELKRTGVVAPINRTSRRARRKKIDIAPTVERRLKVLEGQIESLDSSIIINRAAGQVVAAVVYGYYREGKDSVGVGQAVGLKPCAVRQLIFRIWQVAKEFGFKQEAGYRYHRKDSHHSAH